MKIKNYILIGLGLILLSSISLNVHYANGKSNDEVILRIDNEAMLTENELKDILLEKYKSSAVHSLENSNVITLTAKKNNIAVPNKEELQEIIDNLPNVASAKFESEQLTEIYYISKLYDIIGNISKDLNLYYQSKYNTEPILYHLETVTNKNHDVLMNILKELDQGTSNKSIEKKYNVSMTDVYQPSLASLKEQDPASEGKFFHMMLENNEMMLASVKNELKFDENNKQLFKNFYINNNYLKVRSDLLNTIKSEYTISYN